MNRHCPVCKKDTFQQKLCGSCNRWFCVVCRNTNGGGIIEERD